MVDEQHAPLNSGRIRGPGQDRLGDQCSVFAEECEPTLAGEIDLLGLVRRQLYSQHSTGQASTGGADVGFWTGDKLRFCISAERA